ncbi:low affinity immunoglobulin epsilon Fc receptor-like [Mercenaria mercenaria]|uniref:low affinity immunoglobulin epsilon Fc receptor-like n=1 Tax=Mercenaria mercenaria TaxID=6596 RepID=UPI00234F39D3|nr:low affinity immunoglobulin epsilon Fc receptor-like [Mercenaria mercenaria]
MQLPIFIILLMVTGIIKGCPSGWLRHENKCYHFSHDTETWLGAIDMCSLLGGKLVEIETATENSYLAANAKLFKLVYWVGLTDVQEENIWVWIKSKAKLADTGFSSWAPNEPNNSSADENCVLIRTDGSWNDYGCAKTLHYICEADNQETEIVG